VFFRRDESFELVVRPAPEGAGLAGLAFGADGKLYFVDMVGARVLRLEAKF
jgi:streptogramin lyase